jgi:predicted Zn finger-like uncharacterized protein
MEAMRVVHCEACGAGHEVERILIGPKGTPIKCGHCQAVFSVIPDDESKLSSPVVWIVRDPEGKSTPFNCLGVLQKMILDGQARPDWELSRFGEPWKVLFEIEGLRVFFERASIP